MIAEIACEWTRTSDPATEPLSLSEAKQQASIVAADDDGLLAAYIVAARQAAEAALNRGLITQTWTLQLQFWSDEISLPMAAPLQNDANANPSTAPVVKYYDTSGVLQTLATTYYLVDTTTEPGCIRRAPNQIWPSVQCDRARPIVITYVAGWLNADAVPEIIKHGMRLYVAYADADRLGSVDADAARRAAESCWRSYGAAYWKAPQLRCLPRWLY